MKSLTLAIAVAAALGTVTVAWAGYKTTNTVSIVTNLAGGKMARGSMGAARNSSDTFQQIGCRVEVSGTGNAVHCFAQDASNAYLNCRSTAPNFVNVGLSIASDSYIYFTTDAAGNCVGLYVDTNSTFAPKL